MEKVSVIPQLKIKKPADLSGTIIIRGFYNRRPVAAKSTGYRIEKQHWDHANRCVLKHCPNAHLINTCLKNRLTDIQSDLLQKEIMGTIITPQHIANAIRGINPGKDFFEYSIEKIREDYQNQDTIRGYESELNKLRAFKNPVFFADITPQFLQRYRNFLRDHFGNKPNTQWKSLKFVYMVINKALKEGGIIRDNPFENFDRGRYTEMPKTYLTIDEINSIELLIDAPATHDTLRKVAIRFLLMVYSGMRFGDAMKFDAGKHIVHGRLQMQYKKWGGEVNYKVHSRLNAIIAKVKEHPLKLSVQKFNDWLKMMAIACKIEKKITTHTGRHTLGHLMAELNVPKEKARLILAHKNMKSTDTYYHVTESQVDREIDKLENLV